MSNNKSKSSILVNQTSTTHTNHINRTNRTKNLDSPSGSLCNSNVKHSNEHSIKKIIFPKIANDKITNLMIDSESTKFITFASTAEIMTKKIIDCLGEYSCPPEIKPEDWEKMSLVQRGRCLVITEMTAGVGGNVISFAYHFKYVNAIEIDKVRFDYLNNNLKQYEIHNVNTYNADSTKLLIEQNNLVQDIVFFDPPWGGKDYKLHESLKIQFMNETIESICQKLLDRVRTKMIVMKLPNNYDFKFFEDELKMFKINKYPLDRLTMIIIRHH